LRRIDAEDRPSANDVAVKAGGPGEVREEPVYEAARCPDHANAVHVEEDFGGEAVAADGPQPLDEPGQFDESKPLNPTLEELSLQAKRPPVLLRARRKHRLARHGSISHAKAGMPVFLVGS
jgi:hypothetical protein